MNWYDISGTDDDFLPPHQSRMGRGGHVSGNGRAGPRGSISYHGMYDVTEMEAKIHELEQEAYISVLRAFKAQADALTWDKESLITELRKELRLSSEEHGDLLKRVNSDETVRKIREWRQSGGFHLGMHATNQPTMAAVNQSTSSAAKHGSFIGVKGKLPKSMLPGSSSLKAQYPSGPVGRGQYGNRNPSSGLEHAERASYNSLIGRKVRTRWPDDNNFYVAMITDYNPVEGRHALVYDIGTANESWEWVDLSEISPQDIQWEGEDPDISRPVRSAHVHNDAGRGRGLTKGRFPPLPNGIGKNRPAEIQLLHTDSLIKEVEKVIGASQPDLAEIEKAKNLLKDHEQALSDAIARLGELSDGGNGNADHFLHYQPMARD